MSDATIIREVIQPLTRSAQDYDSLLALIGDARFALLGEPSHGTHEFYAERAAITKRRHTLARERECAARRIVRLSAR